MRLAIATTHTARPRRWPKSLSVCSGARPTGIAGAVLEARPARIVESQQPRLPPVRRLWLGARLVSLAPARPASLRFPFLFASATFAINFLLCLPQPLQILPVPQPRCPPIYNFELWRPYILVGNPALESHQRNTGGLSRMPGCYGQPHICDIYNIFRAALQALFSEKRGCRRKTGGYRPPKWANRPPARLRSAVGGLNSGKWPRRKLGRAYRAALGVLNPLCVAFWG
jgi:hypothetical protein